MERALDLAERGRYTVSPNPMVGAVLARDGRIVGEGLHRQAGGPHAEVEALARAGLRASGSDLYVTLEPCAHVGRTPPCAPAIMAAGVRRVIVAGRDPNPLVAGRGLATLRKAGIKIVMADTDDRKRTERQNEKYLTWITEKRPFVLAKWGATLDGKIATAARKSRWITGRQARERALLLREEYDAVLVGAGTVLADDPLLTRRLGLNRLKPQWRIVLDGRLRVPEGARLFRKPEGVLVVTAQPEGHSRAKRLTSRGVQVWSLPGPRPGQVSLRRLLARLARRQVTSLLVEGGAMTLWEFFRVACVDRVMVFFAPRILGGERAPGAVAGAGFSLAGGPRLREVQLEGVGEDWMVTGLVARRRR